MSNSESQHYSMVAALADAQVKNSELECVLPIFRKLLDKFIDNNSDRIGNGLAVLVGGDLKPTISEYVRMLIRASAALGGERTADLLIGWTQGDSLRFREITTLNGISIDKSLMLNEGLRIYQLPHSSNQLAAHVPHMALDFHGVGSMVGSVALSIECESSSPALYNPSIEDIDHNNLSHLRTQGKIKSLSVDSMCEAMSLACNGCIQRRFYWHDFGDIKEFGPMLGGMSWSEISRSSTETHFTQKHFESALDIHKFRTEKENNCTDPSLDTTIRWWIKSKASYSPFVDQLVDLRIALESLYLNDTKGELQYRLASRGAWHIGQNVAGRKSIFQTLKDVYILASKAIHSGEVKKNDSNEKLFQNAQNICREGILKRLKEEAKPEWESLVMGDNL